jgi:sulfur-carrier protein
MTASTDLRHVVSGETVEKALESLFGREPGLRNHLLDENGVIRPHVSVFVDGRQAELVTPVSDGAEIYVLQAVSGG